MRYLIKLITFVVASFLVITTVFASSNPQVYTPKPMVQQRHVGVHQAPAKAAPQITQEVRDVPPFAGIEVADNLQVVIYGNEPQQKVILVGEPGGIKDVSTEVRNGILYVHSPASNGSSPYGRVLVKICLPRPLCSLTTMGWVELRGEQIRSNGLILCVKNASTVQLHGRINIARVQDDSTGDIDLPYVEGRSIMIAGRGTSHVRLHGRADVLTVRLDKGVCLEAEHMRAHEVYVRTDGYSIAKVFPVMAMYAFAGGDSNIYYFNKPNRLVRYSRESGNILQVAGY